MRVTVQRLRWRGVAIRRDKELPPQLEGDLKLNAAIYGGDFLRRLELHALKAGSTDTDPLAVLYEPTLLRVAPLGIVFRGIEPQPKYGRDDPMAATQDWLVKPR